ncbi:MAG: uroporphyrinogen decarboxylase family protein [Kiritimatiellae bacterium]|nr:uroporphyrinogen decarboxylase family protein [Kiritimatiellia bacterium]
MDALTRWLKTMRFEAVDRPPLCPGGPWESTLRRWEREGLPKGADLTDYFGLDRLTFRHIAIETVLHPPFEERVLEDHDDYVIKLDRHGARVKDLKNDVTMPEFLEYPIKGSADLAWLRAKLDPAAPGRIQPDWLQQARAARAAGAGLLCNGGMYFAFLNEHMGTEPLMYAYADAPDFIHAVNDRQCACCEMALKTSLPHVKLDFVGYHEDMAYKNGPLISPALFREFMTPYYQRIRRVTEPFGVDLHYMDSDGDIRELIPLWLECGIDLFAPMEVAAGMDVVAIRKEYGHRVRMSGGFDKRILAADKTAIQREVERLRPVIEDGGYVPACDHGVPHDVSLENFRHFVECLKTVYGMV